MVKESYHLYYYLEMSSQSLVFGNLRILYVAHRTGPGIVRLMIYLQGETSKPF